MLDSLLIDTSYVGIMVHIEAPEKNISWSGASGTSPKRGAALDPEQPALIASSIKTYVAATMLRLVEQKQLTLDAPVGPLISEKSKALFVSDGYDMNAIRIKHLLSHTSGIEDYTDPTYMVAIKNDPMHRWTRDEQLERTVAVGEKLGEPGDTYSYADANFLLLTEVIEGKTNKPFYTAMRELLRYDEIGLDHTWFPTLEPVPENTKPLVYQYWSSEGLDSYGLDISVDLYGGGGIACPPMELAKFSWNLFNGNIVTDTTVLNMIFTKVPTQDSVQVNYMMGLSGEDVQGLEGFGHGGFWGTTVNYFPALNASVSIYILERDKRGIRKEVMEKIVGYLSE